VTIWSNDSSPGTEVGGGLDSRVKTLAAAILVVVVAGCCGPRRAAVHRGGGDREGDQEAATTDGYGLEEVVARGGSGV
jgi:hypothetical protein